MITYDVAYLVTDTAVVLDLQRKVDMHSNMISEIFRYATVTSVNIQHVLWKTYYVHAHTHAHKHTHTLT